MDDVQPVTLQHISCIFSALTKLKKKTDYSLMLLVLSETGLKLVQLVRKTLFQHPNTHDGFDVHRSRRTTLSCLLILIYTD